MKVLGSGLSLSPTDFSLSVPPQKPALIHHHCEKFKTDKAIEFKKISLAENLNHYKATIAAQFEIKSLNYIQF